MAAISSEDARLLAAELPAPDVLEFSSDVFPTRRGVLEYRSVGPADAPAVVLLHGLGSSSAGYRAQLAGLAREFRVIAWNAPGFGRSARLAAEQPVAADHARALGDLLTALGIDRVAVLAGSSWGSVVAAAFASGMPQRLDALLLSAPNTARGRLTGTARADALAAMLRGAAGDEDRAVVAQRLLAPDAPPVVRALVERLRDAVTPGGWHQAVHALFSVHTPDLLAGWRGATAIVAGTEDKLAPIDAHAAVLTQVLPQAHLHRLQGIGHMPKLEAPAYFNALIRALAHHQPHPVFQQPQGDFPCP